MKQEIELRAVTRSPIPLYPKEDTANAVRNIAMAEARMEAERKLQRMEEQIERERARQPYCSSSRADHMRGPSLTEFAIVGGLTAFSVAGISALVTALF